MKKHAFTLVLVLMLALILVACTNSDDKTVSDNSPSATHTGGSEKDRNTNSKNENNNLPTDPINPFENLIVSFEGWNSNGQIIIDTTNCGDIKTNVTFTYDTELNGHLENGSYITIKVEYDSKKVSATQDEKEYEVTGLCEFYSCNEFSDGVAWINYGNGSENYWSVIDKEGKILITYLGSELYSKTKFENDVSLISIITEDSSEYAIISKTGEILFQPSKELGTMISYGGGFSVFERHVSDFDSNNYILTVLDKNGETAFLWEDETRSYNGAISYCGEGIFAFCINKGYSSSFSRKPAEYFFANASKKISFRVDNMSQFFADFQNDKIIFDNGNTFIMIGDGWYHAPAILTEDGEIITVINANAIEIDLWGKFSDNKIVIAEMTINNNGSDPVKRLLYCDATESQLGMGGIYLWDNLEQYIDKMNDSTIDKIVNNDLKFFNDHILLKLQGSDYGRYFVILDQYGKVIKEPTKYSQIYTEMYCGRLAIDLGDGLVVINDSGEMIFSLSDLEATTISNFSDDVAILDGNRYVDKDGNLLFDEIDISGVVKK